MRRAWPSCWRPPDARSRRGRWPTGWRPCATSPGACLLAVEWGPPSGLIVLHWYGTLDAPLPVAQIDVLLVGADERRRGVGRLLLKAAAQAARVAGCGALQLAARPDAPALADFYRAAGFIEAGTRFERPLRKKA